MIVTETLPGCWGSSWHRTKAESAKHPLCYSKLGPASCPNRSIHTPSAIFLTLLTGVRRFAETIKPSSSCADCSVMERLLASTWQVVASFQTADWFNWCLCDQHVGAFSLWRSSSTRASAAQFPILFLSPHFGFQLYFGNSRVTDLIWSWMAICGLQEVHKIYRVTRGWLYQAVHKIYRLTRGWLYLYLRQLIKYIG